MATAVLVRGGDLQQEAAQAVATSAASTRLAQRITMLTASCVLLRREVLPLAAFSFVEFAGRRLPLLRPETEEAALLHKSLCAATVAIEHKYLKKMVLTFHENEDDPDSIIESYTFAYSYKETETSVEQTVKGKSNVKKLTSKTIMNSMDQMLEYCKFICNEVFANLPDSFNIRISLLYTDETPLEYEPVGFSPTTVFPGVFKEEEYLVGKLLTPYHKILLVVYNSDERVKSKIEEYTESDKYLKENAENSPSCVVSQSYDLASENTNQDEDNYNEEDMDIENDQNSLNSVQVGSQPFFESMESNYQDPKSPNSGVLNTNDSEIRCPCGSITENRQSMVRCIHCKYWQHAPCFGLFEDVTNEVIDHCCDICAMEHSNYVCTDPNLLRLDSRLKMELCLFRCVLVYCLNYRYLDVATLVKVFNTSKKMAISIISRLEKEQAFYPVCPLKPIKLPQLHINNKEYIKSFIPKYFHITKTNQKNVPTKKRSPSPQIGIRKSNRLVNKRKYYGEDDFDFFDSSTSPKKAKYSSTSMKINKGSE